MAWYDLQEATDCITFTEWNNMVDYIQHSACTDFTIYGTCPSTGQAFKFSQLGANSLMYGGADTGDDLTIFANSTDARPFIQLNGNDDMIFDAVGNLTFKDNGTDRILIHNTNNNININGYLNSAHFDVALLGDGVLCMKETSTPIPDINYGKIYCKNTNQLFFQDGAGVEHIIAFV